MRQMTGDKLDKSIVPILLFLFEIESDWTGREFPSFNSTNSLISLTHSSLVYIYFGSQED